MNLRPLRLEEKGEILATTTSLPPLGKQSSLAPCPRQVSGASQDHGFAGRFWGGGSLCIPSTPLQQSERCRPASKRAGRANVKVQRDQVVHFSSLAFIEMLARIRRDTTQLVLARTVASMKLPCVTLGSLARTFR